MDKTKYKLAKELLKNKCYNFAFFNEEDKKKWEEYNVPKEIVDEWVLEYLDKLASEIYALLLNDEGLDSKIKEKFLTKISIIMYKSYDFKINYFKEIVSILEKIDSAFTLGFAVTMTDWYDKRGLNLSLLLSDKEKDKGYLLYFYQHYYFDTEERYFGLLPYLYKMKEYDLFNKLFAILYKNIASYQELNLEKGFDVPKMFIEYAKYMNMDYEKYIK